MWEMEALLRKAILVKSAKAKEKVYLFTRENGSNYFIEEPFANFSKNSSNM